MARRPSVRNKNGHWHSEAGGKGRYFGRVDQVSHAEAMRKLWEALAEGDGVDSEGEREVGVIGVGTDGSGRKVIRSEVPRQTLTTLRPYDQTQNAKTQRPESLPPSPLILSTLTVNALAERYLLWLQRHRSPRLHNESQRHLRRFCKAFGDAEAIAIDGTHLEAFTDALRAEGHALLYIRKHVVSVKTMFNRGVKAGWLPKGFRPFESVEGIRINPKPLLESDLPTKEEVQQLIDNADNLMADIIRLYFNTGSRTHELIEARCSDFQANAKTLVLGNHKRSHTMREPTPRIIVLNETAYDIIQRLCQGKTPNDHLIVNGKGNPHNRRTIAQRFAYVRAKAEVRKNITLYSFRHLWISEMLMAGLDSLIVAKMAGTSVQMLERVYAHFRTQSYAEAQSRLDAVRMARGV